MRIARRFRPRVSLNCREMSSLSLAWMNSKRKPRRWPSLCLVDQQTSLLSLWSQQILPRLYLVSSMQLKNQRKQRNPLRFSSSLKILYSKCQKLSLSPFLRKYFKGRSSIWRPLIMSPRETTAIWALKGRGMILYITISLWGVVWARCCLVRGLTRIRQISKLLSLVRS